MLAFQIDEISSAKLKKSEEEELLKRRAFLKTRCRLPKLSRGEGSADRKRGAENPLAQLPAFPPSPVLTKLRQACRPSE
jgi:hypothetical protein